MMHYAANGQILSPVGGYRQAGVSGYTERLLRHLLPLAPTDRWDVYVPRGISGEMLNASPMTRVYPSHLPTHQPTIRIFWEQVILPALLLRDRPDVLFCPLNVVPLIAPCPTVVAIHDLAFLRFPHYYKPAKQRYLAALTRRSVQRAAHIITVSEFTRQEVIGLLYVAPERVTTIHNGRDERLAPPDPAAVAEFRQRMGLPPQFLLYVGTLEPRKNLETLIRAFARISHDTEHALVLAGGKGWYYEPIFALVEQLGLRERVLFPGFVQQDDLALWYGSAVAAVYPSVYEGFGFPPLEALQCGTPVVTSDAASMPEVVGDAALLVDPYDIDGLAGALLRVVTDAQLRDDLRERGLRRAMLFSWDRAARETLAILRQVAAGTSTIAEPGQIDQQG